jgi:hypothetical protein
MSFYSKSVNNITGVAMLLVVIVLGFVVAFTNWYDDRLFGWRRHFFVVLMFVYAAYRGFRLYQEFKKK